VPHKMCSFTPMTIVEHVSINDVNLKIILFLS